MASETKKAAAPWPPALIWAIRIAIIALALYNFIDFADWVQNGNLSEGIGKTFYAIQTTLFAYVINPLSSLAAIVLAVLGRRLWLAAFLAAVPTLFFWANMVAFAIGVMIYGF